MHVLSNRITVDCLLMAGQSNEVGHDSIGSPTSTYTSVQKNTLIWYKPNTIDSTNNGVLQEFLYGKNNQWETAALNYNGPELVTGYNYYQATGRRLLIIKYGYDGSGLVDDGTVWANGLWQWDANSTNASGLLHYSNFINNFIIPCILKCKANGIDLNIKGLSWCQGETDALDAERSAAYETTLIAMINRLVTDLTPYNVLNSGFKPIISRINAPTRTYRAAVRTAQANVATSFNCPLIDTDGYPLLADNVHYTRAGQETHGADVCTALLTL